MSKGFMTWMKTTHPEVLQQYAKELKNASDDIEQHLTEHEHVVPQRKRFGWI